MSLTRIDRVTGVDEHQAPQKVVSELCRVLFETQQKRVEVNNECIQLRQDMEDLKRKTLIR